MAIAANSALKPSRTPIVSAALSKPRPRQVMASRPSTAQRVGMKRVALCSHCGKMNDGTQAPPSITIKRVAKMARLRVASGVLPSAAMSRPKLEVSKANAATTPKKPGTLPSMRTPKPSTAAR